MSEPINASAHNAQSPAPTQSSWLWNKDLAPIPLGERTWGTYNYAALWVAMSVNIPTYILASGLIAGGMNWKQAICTVFLGNLVVLAPMLLIAHAGARYGIPFPVFARSSFGVLAPTFQRFCGRWSRAAGSAFKPGSAEQQSMRCSPRYVPGGTILICASFYSGF